MLINVNVKGLVNLQKLFDTHSDLNDSDKKTEMLKTPVLKFQPSQKLCKFKIMQISI